MDWAAVGDAAAAEIFDRRTFKESDPNIGVVLLTYLLEYQTDRKVTKRNSFLDSIQDDAHFYVFSAITLFWLCIRHLSFYQFLFCFSLITTGLHLFVNYIAFVLLDDDIKWIRRESCLLRAIVKDVEEIGALNDQINKAHQEWDFRLDNCSVVNGESLPESEAAWVGKMKNEVDWVNKIKNIVVEAEHLVGAFERFQTRSFSSKLDLVEVAELFRKTRRVKVEINVSFAMKKNRDIRICESLEKLWSIVRKLLDRPIKEYKNKWVNSKLRVGARRLITSLVLKVDSTVKLIGGIKSSVKLNSISSLQMLQTVELQLTLLHPFLRHIQEFNLESEIEKAWLTEMDEIVGEAKAAIDKFSQATTYQSSWLRAPNSLSAQKARRNLEADIKCINVGFSELVERKKRYGFKFVIRDSLQSTHQYFDRKNDNSQQKFLSAVDYFGRNLDPALPQFGSVSNEVGSLCQGLENMRRLLDNTDPSPRMSNLREAWLEQMVNIANMAAETKKGFLENSGGLNHRFRNTKARLQLSGKIEQIKHLIYLLEQSIGTYNIEVRDESSSVVGQEEDADSVISRLTTDVTDHQDCCSNHIIVSIVGMEGIGKTTLAKKIYSHKAIIDRFHSHRAWISVPENCNNKLSFWEDVGQQILEENEFNTEEHLKGKIGDFLNKDVFFLVYDDVSTKEAWDELTSLKTSKGSRILVTTRNEDVAAEAIKSGCRPGAVHRLRLRSNDESLSLLKQMVYISSKEEGIAYEIVNGCLGLPLSIVRVGYMMLKQDATPSEALSMIPLLRTAHKESPSHLKQLLEHFELFPRDFEIPARRLVALWVAEGLVSPQPSAKENETLEQVAEKYLYELIDHGIVQIVKKKASGKVKTCRLSFRLEQRYLKFSSDSLYQKEKKLSHDSTQKFYRRSVDRVAPHFNKSGLSFCQIHSNGSTHDGQVDCRKIHRFLPYDPREDDEPGEDADFFLHTGIEIQDGGRSNDCIRLDYKYLCSFLFFDPREGDKPGERIGGFVRKGIQCGDFQHLKVLDLEHVFKPELPNNIGKLKKLKYLGLRWTYLQEIPSSIGELLNLETLDVKHTYIRSLPSSVWKPQRLRHLYLSQSNRSKFLRQPRESFLRNLETLWGVFMDKDSPLKDCLDKFVNLRKLGLALQLDVPEHGKSLAYQIAKLKHLQSLRLRSINKTGEPQVLFLKLSGLANLSSIELFGMLENPSVIPEFPQKLTELTLSASGLIEDPMLTLGTLQKLKSLCFYSNSYKGISMRCRQEAFPQLLVLKLWKLEELKEWTIEDKALQNLRELEIRSCNNLKVPDGLKKLKNLLELKLTYMPDEFTWKIESDKRQIWDDMVHSPSIEILDDS